MEFYLITGFLGAGKTTFLKKFIHLFKDKRIHLVINEFGKEGVDGLLVKELNAVMSEINNGSIFCACRLDKFEDELNKIKLSKPEVVIVEASGLSDPTNIRKVLDNPAYANEFDYKGSVCLVDALRFLKVCDTARVVPKQLKVSGLALINKTDLVEEEAINEVIKKVKVINPTIVTRNTQFGDIKKEWLDELDNEIDVEECANHLDITLQKGTLVLNDNITEDKLKDILKIVSEDTYRIKGFVNIDSNIKLVNCVGNYTRIENYNGDIDRINHLVVLAGEGMSLRKTFKVVNQWHSEYIKDVIL